MYKKILMVLLICMVVISSSFVYAKNWPTPGAPIGKVQTTSGTIIKTIILVVKPLAIGAIVIAGLRYMFASPDTKADIKKDIIYIVVGSIFIFSTSLVVDFVVGSANQIIK